MVRQAVVDWIICSFFKRLWKWNDGFRRWFWLKSCDWNDDGQIDLGGEDDFLSWWFLGGINSGVAAAVMPEVDVFSRLPEERVCLIWLYGRDRRRGKECMGEF